MSIDKLIAGVIMGEISEDEGIRKATCTMVASRKMWCDTCGTVLDEKTIVVYEMRGKILGACCQKCAKIVEPFVKEKYPDATITKWNG